MKFLFLAIYAALSSCSQSNHYSSSQMKSEAVCGQEADMTVRCMSDYTRWEIKPLRTGHFGKVRDDGTRVAETAAVEGRNGAYFVFGPYIDTGFPGYISGGITLKMHAVLETKRLVKHSPSYIGGPGRWLEEDFTGEVKAKSAFKVDMVANVDGKQVIIGQREFNFGNFKQDDKDFDLEEINVTFARDEKVYYKDVEIRIYDGHPSLNMTAIKSYVETHY